jgi:hypothetical protein
MEATYTKGKNITEKLDTYHYDVEQRAICVDGANATNGNARFGHNLCFAEQQSEHSRRTGKMGESQSINIGDGREMPYRMLV